MPTQDSFRINIYEYSLQTGWTIFFDQKGNYFHSFYEEYITFFLLNLLQRIQKLSRVEQTPRFYPASPTFW